MNSKSLILDLLTSVVLLSAWLSSSELVNAADLRLRKTDTTEELLPAIEVLGNKFFDTVSGEQFFIKGIAYQPSVSVQELENMNFKRETMYIDPLASPEICLRDIPYLVKLGVNTIRVYSIDSTQGHDICMNSLADNGIYVLLDLSEPAVSISRNQPHWDVSTFQRYKDVVDSMHTYSNVLGFFAGNEVTNDITNTDASPFVKASIRDIKNHIKESSYRPIPVGYSTNDDLQTRENLANYFACGEGSADFYGINMYEWCGYSSYGTSGYKDRTMEFKNYPVPIFFSVFGCNTVRPRPFTEVQALYGPQMANVWSGGLAYMYFEEENEYGIVRITDDLQVKELEDFKYLQHQFSQAHPQGITKQEYINTRKKDNNLRQCPPLKSTWKASIKLPATPDELKCACLEETLPCLVPPFDSPSEYKKHFDYVCGQVDCSDIGSNGETGDYGVFSDCSAIQKLSLQISKIYFKNGGSGTQCPLPDANVFYNKKSALRSNAKCIEVARALENSSRSLLKDKDNPISPEDGFNRRKSIGSNLLTPRFSIVTIFTLGILLL